MSNIVYGAHALYCGICHKAPEDCTCDVFMQWWDGQSMTGYIRHKGHRYAAFLDGDMQQQRCKCCQQLMPASTPARDEKPQTWRDKPGLI